ncbi:Transient Receptor Potential Cation Channel Subfamily V Member 1 [Manis pentadactyla]|nr:Transient Receptor Potential Cation Channel Subfamily V Member 1 [Manis pentadactyla]
MGNIWQTGELDGCQVVTCLPAGFVSSPASSESDPRLLTKKRVTGLGCGHLKRSVLGSGCHIPQDGEGPSTSEVR